MDQADEYHAFKARYEEVCLAKVEEEIIQDLFRFGFRARHLKTVDLWRHAQLRMYPVGIERFLVKQRLRRR